MKGRHEPSSGAGPIALHGAVIQAGTLPAPKEEDSTGRTGSVTAAGAKGFPGPDLDIAWNLRMVGPLDWKGGRQPAFTGPWDLGPKGCRKL